MKLNLKEIFSSIHIRPLSLVWIAPVILFLGTLIQGKSLYWGTPSLQFIPWHWLAVEQLKQGIFPLWNPYNGMGAPLYANYQAGLLYPPTWITLAVGAIGGVTWLAWAHTLLTVFHLGWGGWGMVHLTRKLGLNEFAQLIAGLAFALCSYSVSRAGFFSLAAAFAWIPWVLRFCEDFHFPSSMPENRWKFRFSWGLCLCLTMQLLAGHAQLTWYTLLFSSVWVLRNSLRSKGWKDILSCLISFGVSAGLAALICAVQLIPTFEFLVQSQRSSSVDFRTAASYSYWPWRLITLFAPNFFGNPGQGNYWGYASFWEDANYFGFLPWVLALSTIPWLFKRNGNGDRSRIRFLWGAILVIFILALGTNTPIFPFLYQHIPTFNMFNAPTRFMALFEVSGAVLAGFAAHSWRSMRGKQKKRLKQAAVAAAAVSISAAFSMVFLKEIPGTFTTATFILGVTGFIICVLAIQTVPQAGDNENRRLCWEWLVALLLVADLLLADWGMNPGINKNFFTAQGQNQLMTSGGGRSYLSFSDEYLLKFRRFVRFSDFAWIEAPVHLRQVSLANLNILDGTYSANNFDPLMDGRYSRWMNALDDMPASLLASSLKMMNVTVEEKIDVQQELGLSLVSHEPWGRFYWRACAVNADGEEDAWKQVFTLATGTEDALQRQVVAEGDLPEGSLDCSTESSASILVMDEKANEVTLQVSAQGSGWLVMADTWYPGWRASIDDKNAIIYRTNYLFRGVYLPPGEHRVKFQYDPQSFSNGLLISGLGLVIFIILFFWQKTRDKNRRTDQEAS